MQLDAGLIPSIHSPALWKRLTPGQAGQIPCPATDNESVTNCDKHGQAQAQGRQPQRWPAPAGQGHPHPLPCPRTKASTGPGAPVAQRRGPWGGAAALGAMEHPAIARTIFPFRPALRRANVGHQVRARGRRDGGTVPGRGWSFVEPGKPEGFPQKSEETPSQGGHGGD